MKVIMNVLTRNNGIKGKRVASAVETKEEII